MLTPPIGMVAQIVGHEAEIRVENGTPTWHHLEHTETKPCNFAEH